MRFEGRTAIVTGGSRGIGRACVKRLAAEGAKVAIVYHSNRQAADALLAELKDAPGQVRAFQADVRDLQRAHEIVDPLFEQWGHIDVLVNSAGIVQDGLLGAMTQEQWRTVIDTNLGGTFNYCHAVTQPMMMQRRGSIVNLSSTAAEFAARGQVNYAASKGGINGLTRALAKELAPRNVRVNADRPGHDRNRHEPGGARRGRRPDQEDDSAQAHRLARGDRRGGGLPGQRRRRLPDRSGAAGRRRFEFGRVLAVFCNGGKSGRRRLAARLSGRDTAPIATEGLPSFSSYYEHVWRLFMPTKEEVFEKIRTALVDALGVDEEDVTPQATLVGDLGAESIDFLDIVFRLEKAFDIKIPRGELFPEDILTDAKYVQDGKVTEEGVGRIAEADALCQSRRVRQEADCAGLRQPPDGGRHVPVRGRQSGSEGLVVSG